MNLPITNALLQSRLRGIRDYLRQNPPHIPQDTRIKLVNANERFLMRIVEDGPTFADQLASAFVSVSVPLDSAIPLNLSIAEWLSYFDNRGVPLSALDILLKTIGALPFLPTVSSSADTIPPPLQPVVQPSWWSKLFCSCLWRQPSNDTLVLAIMTQQLALIERLPDQIAAKLAEADDMGTVLSDPQYEEDARNWLPSQLLQRCGLIVVENVALQRADEWDFRSPVVFSRTEPNSNTELGVFEVFPSGTPAYIRPPIVSLRNITPTKFSNSALPPSAPQYYALFEFTASAGWANKSKRKFDGTSKTMATRLNERLTKSLDRAKDSGIISRDARITDLVAVIGVVAPTSCAQSITLTMSRPEVPLLLKEMMDANRFVVLIKPKGTLPSSSRSSPSCEAEKQ